jgi:prolyl oligopeptidase
MQSVEDVKNKINKYDRYGVFQETIKLPGIGAIGNWGCEKEDSLIYYTFTNSLSPSAIHKYDITTNTSELYYTSKINFNANDFVTKQIFYTSKDGTKIPMTITHKSDINLNGKNPTILYGYGGFNVNLMPSFSAAVLFWLKMGGVYAVANLRGGGEYGNKWHEQGIKMKKQNVFDDFFAAAQYLNDQKYANAEHLAISGGSNGGLLVGATMTQHPELCKVALPAVGVLDMLRYHKFTAGAGWAYDYGTSEDSKDMFDYLKSYSPVHNVSKKCYPATMVTTGDHDDRVIPAHSFKFAAKLQADQNCDNPILIRIDVRAGHGAGKSTEQVINETIDKYVFTLHNMGVKSIDENLKLKF